MRTATGLMCLVLACASSKGSEPASPARPTLAPAAPAPIEAPPLPPRLVVAVVFDQLGSDTLQRHLPLLAPSGAIRQAIQRGAYFERGVYPYAKTVTAPGHAAIHTGAPPSVNGVGGNTVWDGERGLSVDSAVDRRYPVYGREKDGAWAGPGGLRVPTVAHALKAQTGGAAKVVSLSLKDRSAIFSVGSAADLVLWYDSTLHAFTSSSAWGEGLPPWVGRYQAEHPISELLVPWLPLSEREYAARLGPDDAAGEGDMAGFGTTFPHRWEAVTKPWSVLSCTPMLSEYLVRLAEAAVGAQDLGRDTVPDLLALSISGTDCAGHIFGPDSWEYVDHLVRADRALGEWLTRLEQTTSIAVLITSDHGVAGLVEKQAAPAGRLVPSLIRSRVEAALAAELGVGPWVQGIMAPYLYLTPRARQHAAAERALERALATLREEEGLAGAWAMSEARQWAHEAEPLRRAMALSFTADASADIVFLTRPHYTLDVADAAGRGTNHGSPYAYDREVPILAWGSAVPGQRQSDPVDQLRVAATLSHLLGVAPPASAAPGTLFPNREQPTQRRPIDPSATEVTATAP